MLKQIVHSGTGVENDFDVSFKYDLFLSQRLNGTFGFSALYDRPRGNFGYLATYTSLAQDIDGVRHLGQDWVRAENDFRD